VIEIVGVLALALCVAAFVVAGILDHRWKEQKLERRRRLCDRLVEKLQGSLEPESSGLPRMRFKLQGREALLEADATVEYTRLSVDVRGLSRGALRIHRDYSPGLVKRLLGMQDIEIGNEAFDRDFIVEAFPESHARLIFSKERKNQAVGAVRKLGTLGSHPRIRLSAEELELQVEAHFEEVGPYLTLVQAASDWLEVLLTVAPIAGIHWLPEEPGRPGICRICGTGLADRIIACSRCNTPHHQECWEYVGRCSTYGCGERRFGPPLRRPAS